MLLAALLLCTSVPAAAFAAEEEYFPEDGVLAMEEDDLNAGEDIAMEEEESPVYEEEEELEEGEIVFPDDSVSDYTEDDVELGMGEEIFPEGCDSPMDEEEELGDAWPDLSELTVDAVSEEDGEDPQEGEEELSGYPQIVLSDTGAELNKGKSTTITVSYTGFTGKITMTSALSQKNTVTTSFSKWNSGKCTLTIKGNSVGKSYVYLYMKSSTSDILASARILVQVYGTPTLKSNITEIKLTPGTAQNFIFTTTNTTGSSYLTYSTTNTSVCSAKWGEWSYHNLPMTVTGKKAGTSTLTVYLKNAAGTTLTSMKVKVTISDKAKLTLSSSSVNINKGYNTVVKVTRTNYTGSCYVQYGSTNANGYWGKWGTWSGMTIPLTITGNSLSKGTIYVYLKDGRTNAVLAQTSIKVTVNDEIKITPSKTSMSVECGSKGTVNLTVSGASGGYYVKYGRSPSEKYIDVTLGKWNGTKLPVTFTAKNPGQTTVQFNLYSSLNNKLLAATKVTVQSTGKAVSPKVKVSPTALDIRAGNTSAVTVTYEDLSNPELYELAVSTTNNTAYTTKWGSWSGNSVPLNVTGVKKGSGTVKVYLRRAGDKAEVASASFTVNVTEAPTISNLSYSFSNFSEGATLDLCKVMFGKSEHAKAVYDMKVGVGGNCFGMATSAGLFAAPGNGINPSMFNSKASSISQLSKSDRYSTWGLTVKQFLMGMHIAQVSKTAQYAYEDAYNASTYKTLVNTVVSEAAAGRPVMLGVFYDGGHAILAYGFEKYSSSQDRFLIYDNNYPQQTRYMYLTKNSSGSYTGWTYEIFNGTTWRSSYGAEMAYLKYSDYSLLWTNRGKLVPYGYNMMSINSDDFTVKDVNDNVVATVTDGELQTNDENITKVRFFNLLPDGTTADMPSVLYLPVRLYTVENHDDSVEELKVSLTDRELGTKVSTTADAVTLCSDDSCLLSSALLFDCQDEEYSISLTSSRPGETESITWSGTANDDVLSVSMDGGSLEVCNLSLEDLSMGAANGSHDTNYAIMVSETENGVVENPQTDIASAGESRTYTFVPDEGYEVDDVLVDGQSQGSIDSYTFSNISASHSLEVTFAKKAKLATPKLSSVTNTTEGIKLAWNRVDRAKQYRVFYKTGTGSWKKLVDTADLTYIFKTAVSGTQYTFTVRCLDQDGVTFRSDYDPVGKTITYVAAPSIKNLAVEGSSITMNWDASAGASSYRIFYKTNGGTWKKLADTASASYTWTGPVNGNTYAFTVRCLGADGKGFVSGYDNTGKSILFQSVPQISSAVSTAEGIKLSWKAFEGAGTYRIFYKEGSGSWKKLADTAAASYVWTGAESGKTYSFTLRGMNAAGTSYTTGYDNTGKSVIYIAAPKVSSVTNTTEGVKIAWTRSEGAAAYRIFYKTNGGTWKKLADVTGTSYVFKDAVSAAKYAFTVRCLNAAGTGFTSGYDNAGKEITYIAAPLVKSAAKSGNGVVISWDAVPGAQGYRIFYKTNGGTWKKLTDTKQAGYTWNGAQSGNTYGFTVRCTDGGSVFTSGYDNTGVSISIN